MSRQKPLISKSRAELSLSPAQLQNALSLAKEADAVVCIVADSNRAYPVREAVLVDATWEGEDKPCQILQLKI